MDYTMLVNKDNPICPGKALPFRLVEVENNVDDDHMFLEEQTYIQFLKLKKELANHYNIIIDLYGCYRSFERSQQLFDKAKEEKGLEYAQKNIALPGTSEHHTGLAFDYVVKKNGHYNIDDDPDFNDEIEQINTICYNYGFIVRYPKGKEDITKYDYEPWHLRYVGYDLAKYLQNNNITLDEYHYNLEINSNKTATNVKK